MTKIKQLQLNDENIYPITHESAVLDDNGKSLANKLDELTENITTHTHDQYLTSIPSEYVTETELNAKGYLSSIPSEYVTNTELKNEIDKATVIITPQMFGAKADGVTDDTNAINQAIEYAGNNGVVYIPGGKYIVSSSMASGLDEGHRYVAISIYQKENFKLILSPNAHIKHKLLPEAEIVQYATARYYPIGIISSSNIYVEGGIVEGEAEEHVTAYKDKTNAFWWQADGTYSRGHGYGVCVRGSEHVTVKNMEVFNVFGDALHISLSSKGKSNFVTFENCIGHSSTRQGLSVTGGDNTVVRNCEFYNIVGNSPESGIDFEPDSVANINTNALVENCYIHDCNQHTVIGALANRGIKIKSCRLEGSVTNDGTATEKVEFIDCDIFDYRSSNPERNTVNNCRIGTIGIYESGDDFNDCCISPNIFADNPKFDITAIMSSITIGNSNYPTIKFNNCKFDFSNSMGYASNFIPIRGTQAGKFIFNDCEFDMATHKYDALKFDARDLVKVTDCEFRSVQSTYNKPFVTLNCTNDIILQNNILNLKGITTYSNNPIVDVTGKNIILEHNKILSNTAFGTVPFNIKFSSVGEIYCLRNMADKWGSIGTFPSNPTKMIVGNNIISTSTSLADFTEEYKNKIDNVSDLIQDAGFITEIDAKNYTDKAIANINANGVQQHALFANRIEECTDTTKVYVFPDGYIYAYLATYNPGGAPLHTDVCAISTDTDGSIFNGIGHKLDHRLNSNGDVVADTGNCVVTGFIPITKGDKFYLYNIKKSTSAQNCIQQFKADKTRYGNTYYFDMLTYDSEHDCYVYDTGRSDIVIVNTTVYLRFSVGYTAGSTMFITKNEYASFTEPGYTYEWGNTGVSFVADDFPTKTSQLTNDSGFITSIPSEYVTESELQSSLDNISQSTNNYKTAYGTCSTTASTSEKAIVIDDPNWKLEIGNIIAIKPSVSNSASNVKFNVNGTGAYPLWYNNAEYTSSSTAYTGYANRTAFYMFDGTHWVWLGQSYVASVSQATLGQGYGVCDTAESTLAKACTISSYSLAVGGIVSIKFTNAVPANSTLNIRTRGAKPIFYRGVAITNGIIKAGDTATFIYNGTQYHLISLDNAVGDIPTKTSQLTNDSNFATKDYVDEQLVEREGLPIVNSIEEMTDTSKQYVYIETGTIWEYQEVQYSSKRYTNYYDAERYGTDTYLNKRINSSKQLEEANGMASTDWITLPQVLPAGTPVVIRLKNTKLATGTSRFFLMNLSGKGSQFTADDGNTNKEFTAAYPTYNNAFTLSYEGDVKVYTSKPPNTEVAQVAFAVNINEGQVITKSDVENVIITVNEPIDETPLITSEWKWVDTGEYDTKGGTIVVQELGDNPIAVMSQRAVTEAIDELKGLDIVASTEEMTDKKKKYVHKDTNTIWEHVEYEAFVKNNEFSKTTGKLNTRISSSGSESSRDGCFLTDYIDISDHTLPHTLNLSGVPKLFNNYDAFYHFSFYDENKSLIVSANSGSYGHTPTSDGDILKLPITISNIYPTEASLSAKYVRIRLSIKPSSTSISWSDVENLVINLAWKDKSQMISKWVDTGEYDNSHGVTVVQEAGISPSLVMSQKAVTELIQNATGGGTVNLPRVDSVEEMTDTTQSYVLTTTNTVWSYMETEGDPIELYDISKVTYNARYSGSPGSEVAYAGYSLTDYIPVDNTADDPQLIIEYDGTINTDLTTQPYFNKMTPHDANKTSLDVVYMNHGSVNSWKYDILTNKLVVHFKYLGNGSVYANLSSLAYVRLDVKHEKDTGETVMAKIKSIKCPTIKEKISTWTDTGMSAEQANTSYMDLVVKISENEEYINEVSRRVAKIETGSGSVSVPGFWTSAVDDCIAKIKNNQQGRNCVTFPFFSDHHVRGGYVGALIAKVMQECNIPYCVFGGDSISSGYMKDGVSEMIRDEYKFKDLMSYIPEGRLIRTPGNHDGYCAVSADERYYYTKDQIYDLFFRDIAIQQNKHFDSDGTSLYVDDLASKTRFIMLDTNKKMVNNSSTGKTVTDEQLAWLKNEAMKFDEPGWAIVFSSHQPMSNHYHAGISNPEEVYSLLTSYKDSSDTNKADIVGWFSGHIHRDRIWTGKAINTSDDQQGDALPFTQVTISSDATAIAYDDATKHSYGADDQSHCIDFVTINKNTRTVKITRLGIGEDREFTY